MGNVCVDMIGTYGPYSAGLAGAFIDREVETKGVGHRPLLYSTDLI